MKYAKGNFVSDESNAIKTTGLPLMLRQSRHSLLKVSLLERAIVFELLAP